MVSRPISFIVGAAVVVLASACGGSNTAEPPSYATYQQRELEAERQDFIAESRGRLDKVDREIALLETKLKYESPYVDTEQRAKWSQQLFEDKQEQGKLRAELYRAQNVTPAEWKQMRGTMGRALDDAEAGVAKMRADMMHAFSRPSKEPSKEPSEESAPAKLSANAGLCPLDVQEADAEVEKTNTSVVLIVTTDTDGAVRELQRRATEFANQDAYTPASGNTAPTKATGVVPVQITAQNIEDGVRLSFVPSYKGHLEQLHGQIAQDAAQLGKDRCEIGTVTGMR